MNVSRLILRSALVGGLALLCAVMSGAAEEGGSSAAHVMSSGAFKWVHFVIVAIALYWVFAKALPPKFLQNAEKISAAITRAASAKAEAEKQLQESATKLASLEKEVAQFRAQVQKDAAAELERLRAATKTDAEKIGIAAKAEVEAAERAAHIELKELAAKLAMDQAESLVAKELTPAVQEAMLNDFVQRLQGRPN